MTTHKGWKRASNGGLFASKGQSLLLMPHCLLKCVCTCMGVSMSTRMSVSEKVSVCVYLQNFPRHRWTEQKP